MIEGKGPLKILPKRTKKKRTSKDNTTILAIRLGQNTFPNDITFLGFSITSICSSKYNIYIQDAIGINYKW